MPQKMVKEITIEEAKKEFKCRPAFKILIRDREHQVWNITGYHHKNGEWNGTPTEWWVELEGGSLVPYVNIGNHRICWEINFKQSNTVKVKWDDVSIRGNGTCVLKANGREVYSFQCSDLHYAMIKAQKLTVDLVEHPYNFLNPEEEKGRRIWYYNLPARIQPSEYHPGEIRIIPDYIDEYKGHKNHWMWWRDYYERSRYKGDKDFSSNEEERLEEAREMGGINHGDVLWDGNIGWFRSEETEEKKEPESQPRVASEE